MKTDKTIEHGILLVKLLLKDAPHGNEIDTFPSLDVLKTFKIHFVLGDTMYQNVLRILRAFDVIWMTNYNEITLNKKKFEKLCELKPLENDQAEKRFKELDKK